MNVVDLPFLATTSTPALMLVDVLAVAPLDDASVTFMWRRFAEAAFRSVPVQPAARHMGCAGTSASPPSIAITKGARARGEVLHGFTSAAAPPPTM